MIKRHDLSISLHFVAFPPSQLTSPPSTSPLGSDEERIDVIKAYDLHEGSLPDILSEIMFSSSEDEPRLMELVQAAIEVGDLKETKLWKLSSKDEKSVFFRAVVLAIDLTLTWWPPSLSSAQGQEEAQAREREGGERG